MTDKAEGLTVMEQAFALYCKIDEELRAKGIHPDQTGKWDSIDKIVSDHYLDYWD